MTTIATEAEIRTAAGLYSSITDEERAVIALKHPQIEAKVMAELGYDPVQKTHSGEIGPMVTGFGSGGPGTWDVNPSHTTAYFSGAGTSSELQLRHLPVRSVSSVRVDQSARHGQASSSFPASTAWTQGDDYWIEWENRISETVGLCLSGILKTYDRWPVETGTVLVTYVAGYSQSELRGTVGSDSASDANSEVSQVAANEAAAIKDAVIVSMLAALNAWGTTKKKTASGWTGGPLVSERLGDYSYTLGANVLAAIAGMTVDLPAEAKLKLSTFRHCGLLRL